MASQMAAAKLDRVRVELASLKEDVVLSASGSRTLFDGFLKIGRFGPFVGCAEFPVCGYSRPLSGDPAEREEARRPVVLFTDGETGLVLTLRSGHYIQWGEDEGDARAAH